ncbi:MAG TPA: hypothetical protein VFH11_06345 [Gemmatimonadota bacterium]|nr:hypothetical protein [Gemmatimonadota bacterium]
MKPDRSGSSTAMRRWIARAAVIAVLTGLTGCGDLLQEPDTGFGKTVVLLEEVSGNAQVGTPGAPLPQPLRVQTVDFEGDPAPRLWVQWSVISGSGDVEPRNSFSDENGIAEATWTLGASAGTQQVQAVVRKGQPVIFEATAE